MKIDDINTFVLESSRKKGAVGDLIRFAYKFFSHEWVDIITSITGTVIIALLIGCGDYSIRLVIACTIYVVLLLLSTWAKAYKHKIHKNLIDSSKSLNSLSNIIDSWQYDLYSCAKKINQNKDKDQEVIAAFLSDLSFQSAAFYVCRSIRELVAEQYQINIDDVYITVFQRIQSASSDVCKMIAYSCTQEPTTYGHSYTIPKRVKNKKIEFHTYKFAMNETNITVALNRTEVEKCFVMHQDNLEREEKIQQYICFPIAIAKSGVLFLLQIDTSVEGLFGNDTDSAKKFVANNVYPFGQFLHMVYEEQRTIEQLREINYGKKENIL